MLQVLVLSLPRNRCCLHSLDDIVGLNALSIGLIGLPVVAKSSSLEH
jgi:hypothetical protein